jgi:uncharacterized membrane protein
LAIGLMVLGFSKTISVQAGFSVHIFALINVLILFFAGFLINYFSKRRKKKTLAKT